MTHAFPCLVDMRRDVQEIFRMTPHEKQVMMFSATLSKEIRPVCRKFMQDVNTFSLLSLHPAHCLLPAGPLPPDSLSFKHHEGHQPVRSDGSLKRRTEQRQLALGSARVPGTFRKTWSG